jgi:hypothetical protein
MLTFSGLPPSNHSGVRFLSISVTSVYGRTIDPKVLTSVSHGPCRSYDITTCITISSGSLIVGELLTSHKVNVILHISGLEASEVPVIWRKRNTASISTFKCCVHLFHEQHKIVCILIRTASTLRLTRILPINIGALKAIRVHETNQ